MKNEKTVITNLIISSVTQLIILALGLVLPRIILTSWGSEYNGLINSVTTIMRYLSLLEAGINTSTLQALYKSIGENDRHQTSVIIRSAKQYYHNVSVIYTALVLLISFVYPLFLCFRPPRAYRCDQLCVPGGLPAAAECGREILCHFFGDVIYEYLYVCRQNCVDPAF